MGGVCFSSLVSEDAFAPLLHTPGQTNSGKKTKVWFSKSTCSSSLVCVFPLDLSKALLALLISAMALEEASGFGIHSKATCHPSHPAEPTQVEIQPPKSCPQRGGSEPTTVPITEQSERIQRGNKSPVAPIATRRN